MRKRYSHLTERKARSVLLDESVNITGWNRKHTNKILFEIIRKTGTLGKRGAPKTYNDSLIQVLKNAGSVWTNHLGNT